MNSHRLQHLMLMLLIVILGRNASATTSRVTWSDPAINKVLVPGQSRVITVSFAVSDPLTSVSVFVVQQLQSTLSVSPSSFSAVLPGKSYTILLSIDVPSDTQVNTTLDGTIHLRVGGRTVPSPLKVNLEINTSSFERPDPSKLFHDPDGSTYPLDQAIITLDRSASFAIADRIAQSVGGSVVGAIPNVSSYELTLPTRSRTDLENALTQLKSAPDVASAFKNFVGDFFGQTDLDNLGACNPTRPEFIRAYDRIRLREAYGLLASRISPFSPLTVGIVDSGIDRTHVEFIGVDTGIQSPTSPSDLRDHGTEVAGIIGANNLGLAGSCGVPSKYQMNGLVSGLPIPYKIRVRGFPILSTAEVAADFDTLGAAGIPVVNLSWGVPSSTNTMQLFLSIIEFHAGTTMYVIAAGESNKDAGNVAPANLGGANGLSNVITVGGTDPIDDSRSDAPGLSNWGPNIDLAAPGKNVYAPGVSLLNLINPFTVFASISPTYELFSGTSASAPMVTGAAGILQSLGAGGPANLKFYLTASGDPIVTDKPIGGRRLNVFCAVQLVLPPSQILSDDFGEGYRDCSRWFTTVQPPGIGLMAVANQQLEMVKASSGIGYMGLASRCKVAGDFDVQVDYRLSIWPAQNFHTVRLMASDLPDGGTGFPGVYRNSYADENYQFRNQLGLAGLKSVSTSDTSGTIGLKRTGQMLSGYTSHGTIGSAPTTSNATGFTIDFATPSDTAPGDVAIAFDNFRVNAGTVTCP